MKYTRNLGVLCCLSLSSLAFTQLEAEALSVPVSLDAVAMPIGRVLDTLSQKTNVKLTAIGPANQEYVVVRVKDVPLRDLMTQMSKVTRCNWRIGDSGYELILGTPGNDEALDKTNALRKSLQEKLKARTQAARPTGEVEMEEMSFGGMGGGPSGSKAILQLILAQPLQPIAMLPDEGRMVFSSAPTRTQLPMRGNVQQIITQLIQEHNAETAKRSNQPTEIPEEAAPFMEFLKEFGIFDEAKPIETRAAKALLVVESGGGFMSMKTCTLRLYDGQGKVLFQATETLEMDFAGIAPMAASTHPGSTAQNPQEKPKPAEPGDDKPVTWSASTKELMALWGDGAGSFTMVAKTPSKELSAKLLNPDQYDPLSFGSSDGLMSVASARNWNLVACLPDSYAEGFGMFRFMNPNAPAPTVGSVRQEVEANENLIPTRDGNWWLIQPKYHAQSRRERLNRPALGKLLQNANQKGMVTLDDLADYAMVNNSPMDTPVAMGHIMVYAPGAMSRGMSGMNDWRMLRFYGTMGPNQRAQMRQGLELDFRQFSQAQRNAAEAILFGAGPNIEVGPPPKDVNEFDQMMRSMMGGFMPTRNASWKQEPTEVMPTGLPASGRLVVTTSIDPCGIPVETGNEMFEDMGAIGPWELAMLNLMREMPGMEAMGGAMPELTKLRLGERSTYKFRFDIDPEARVNKNLIDDQIKKDAQIIDLKNPPADFKARIDRATEMIKKSPFFRMMQGAIGREGVPAQPPRL